MKIMSPQVNFCSGNICIDLSFQIKNPNSKKFVHVGFCAPKMLKKFLDFAAGMILTSNKIWTQCLRFHDMEISFYGNNLSFLSDCNLAITLAQNCLNNSVNQVF